MNEHFQAIREGLDKLQAIPIRSGDFAAQTHHYRLNPPLGEEEVRAFEERHQIHLPADYRAFMTTLGNGGVGPGYGVFKLGEVSVGWHNGPWEESGYVGCPAKRFPFTAAWKDPDDPRWEAPFDGAIPLSHYGCQTWAWLVVTGPEAGTVWCDDRGDYVGVYPEKRGTEDRMSFLSWYRWWLGTELAKLSANNKGIDHG